MILTLKHFHGAAKSEITKAGIDTLKTESKRSILKTSEISRDLAGNKVIDKVTACSVVRTSMKTENSTNKLLETPKLI